MLSLAALVSLLCIVAVWGLYPMVIGLVALVADQILRVPWADAAGALVIGVLIAREGWSSVRAARNPEPLGLD